MEAKPSAIKSCSERWQAVIVDKKCEKYAVLIERFVSGEISASEFEVSYLDAFKNEDFGFDQDVYEILNFLFSDVDAYCSDPDLRDNDDLDEEQLLNSAKKALIELNRKC